MASARSQRVAVAMVGLAASAVFVSLAMRHLEFASVLRSLRSAKLLPWVPLAATAYLAGHLVRGQRLRVLVRRESTLSLATASNIVVVGYASNNVLPARLGEFVRAGMLAERTGIPLTQSLTITFIERLLDGITILVLLLVGAAALPVRPQWMWDVARLGSLVFGVALAVLLVAVVLPRFLVSLASRVSSALRPRGRDRVVALAMSVTAAGACLRRPRDVVAIGAYSLLVWLLESAMFALILPAFGLKLQLAPALTTMSVTNLGILVPSSPGFVGSFHFFCSQALVAQGVPAATALGFALLVHLTFYVPVTLWGAGAMLWYGVEIGATAAIARAARSSPHATYEQGVPLHVIATLDPPRPGPPASEFDVALVEALVAKVPDEVDRAAVEYVATFLSEEMRALPARLSFLYDAGMVAFRLYVRLRYLRSFCGLGVARRQAAVHSWAFGRVGLLRQLFRPVRSTALLAYYERQEAVTKPAAEPRRGLELVANG
jgi:glycosyltransferase 2 family protein